MQRDEASRPPGYYWVRFVIDGPWAMRYISSSGICWLADPRQLSSRDDEDVALFTDNPPFYRGLNNQYVEIRPCLPPKE